jgi:hypothetical protein
MRLRLEGPLDDEDELPDLQYGRHSLDIGRTWWIGLTWHIWTGIGWQRAIATKSVPKAMAQ